MKRWRRKLIVVGWVLSVLALYYGWSDWRGAHLWDQYRHSYEARVAPLDFAAYVPKEIPDSENFAATPVARNWFTRPSDTNTLFDVDAFSQAQPTVRQTLRRNAGRQFEDLPAWQQAFAAVNAHAHAGPAKFHTDPLDQVSRRQAASAVLDGLDGDKAVFDELRAASARPGARYPIDYNLENPMAILLPHLAKIKQACKRLEIRAAAELALDQTQNALDDLKLSLHLADTLKPEPFLISYLVRVACVEIAVQPIWEGLTDHRWHDTELKELQARLAGYDFLGDLEWPMHGERAAAVLMVELLKKKGLGRIEDVGSGSPGTASHPVEDFLGRIIPSGWYNLEELHYCIGFDRALNGVFDKAALRIFPGQVDANRLQQRTTWDAFFNHAFIEQVMLQAIGGIPIKSAAAQTATDQAATACALERYRLANGHYPDNLSALAPAFMNPALNDVISGQPLHYHTSGDDRFVLYSVGWNTTDEGGQPGSTLFDEHSGDWVW